MQIKSLKIFAAIAATILMICGSAFAGTQTTKPTLKYTDTTTPAAVTVNPFHVTEVGNSGFASAGFFRLVIPASVALEGNSASITRDTTTLGTKASPKSLYVKTSTAGTAGYIFIEGTNQYKILKVYGSSSSIGGTANIVYGSSSTQAGRNSATHVQVADWNNSLAPIGSFGQTSAAGSSQVGTIYYDDTTQETVITLAGKTNTSNSESIWFNGLKLKPVTAGSTGNVNLSILDKDAADANGIGVTDDTTVKVLTMTDQPMSVSIPTGSTPPTIPAGKVAGQPNGEIDMVFVGATTTTTANNKITITLDNGAKFHTGAASTSVLGSSSNAITVAGTAWSTWNVAHPSSLLAVNSTGALVITLGTPIIADAAKIVIPATTKAVIDTSSVTTAGDITATVTGSGTDLAKLSQTAKFASVALTGASVKFLGGSTTAGLDTIYAGRTGQKIDDYLLIGEDAPGSLLAGGNVQLDLNLGAKFTAGSSITGAAYTTSPYSSSSNLALDTTLTTPATASATCKADVKVASTTNLGAWKFGDATSASPFEFDLSKATAGALKMTVSGNAGAAGTVTMATVINATSTTVSSPVTLIPGASAVALPDIVITENHYGALGTSGYIAIHFPSTITLDSTAAITVTSVAKTSGTSSTTAVTKDSMDSNNLYLKVATASTSSSGQYTITIKGIVADVSSSIGSGSASFVITGDTLASGATTPSYTADTKGSNYGAMPTAETVAFGTAISATVPYAGTPVVSGTMVTQTFIPAGNDINKTGDVYVFTSGQYYTGSAWTATETAYKSGEQLNKMTVNYDVNGLPTGSKIYIGYGVGLTGTNATMNSNATFVLAYTTPSSVSTGTAAGATKVSFNAKDNIDIYLNITNNDGIDPSKIKQEWLVFGADVGGIDSGLFFFDGTNVVAYTPGMDLSKVTYKFDHSKDSFKVSTLNLDKLGLTTGDTFWYGYVYSENGIDLTDPTSYSVENTVTITAK